MRVIQVVQVTYVNSLFHIMLAASLTQSILQSIHYMNPFIFHLGVQYTELTIEVI